MLKLLILSDAKIASSIQTDGVKFITESWLVKANSLLMKKISVVRQKERTMKNDI